MANPPLDPQKCWRAFRANPDAQNFGPVYEATKRLVWTICRGVLINPDDARDAYQTTYARLLALAQSDPDAPHPRDPALPLDDLIPLIQTLAGREAAAMRKRRARRSKWETPMQNAPDPPAPTPDPAAQASAAELRGKLEGLISLLPDRLRAPLLLHYLHGMTHEEIARALQCPLASVSYWIVKGRKKLRPLAERAGLADYMVALAALSAGAALSEPPALAAAAVFAQAKAAVASGAVTTAAATTAQTLSGVAAMKAKTLAISAALVVLASAGIFTGMQVKQSIDERAAQNSAAAASAQSRKSSSADRGSASGRAGQRDSDDAFGQSGDSATGAIALASSAANPVAEQTISVRAIWAANQQPVVNATIAARQREARPGADITAPVYNRAAFPDSLEGLAQTRTDAEGRAQLPVPADWKYADLLARHDDGGDASALVNFAQPAEVVIQLRAQSSVFGRVWLEATGRPAAGAKVRLFSPTEGLRKEVAANENGEYQFLHLGDAIVTVSARQGELVSLEKVADIPRLTLTPGQKYGPHDLYLKQGAVLTGKVLKKADAQPLEGATVSIDQYGWTLESRADAKGEYRLGGMLRQSGSAKADADKFASESKDFDFVTVAQQVLNFELDESIEAIITVKDPAGIAVAGAQVAAMAGDLRSQNRGATDSGGRVVLSDLARNIRFQMQASKEGYKSATDPLPMLASGQSRAEVSMVLTPVEAEDGGAFEGKVSDASGAPIAGAKVGWGTEFILFGGAVTTDAQGHYLLKFDQGREGDLVVQADGFASGLKSGPRPGTRDKPAVVDFTLEKGHYIDLSVVDSQSKPIPNAQITLSSGGGRNIRITGGGNPSNPKATGVYRTDAEGKAKLIDLPAPTISVMVSAPGYSNLAQQTLEVDQAHTVKMLNQGVFKGRVMDSQSKQPIADFKIKIMGGAMLMNSASLDGKAYQDAQGRFEIPGLNTGVTYEVTVMATGYSPATLRKVQPRDAAEAAEQLVELSPGNALKAVVVDGATNQPVPGALIYYGNPRFNLTVNWESWLSARLNIDNYLQLSASERGEFEVVEGQQPGTLFIEARNYAHAIVTPADRAAFSNVEGRLSIALKPQSVISGSFTANGAAAPGKALTLSMLDPVPAGPEVSATQKLGSRTTDANGMFLWEGLAAGSYVLSQTAPPQVGVVMIQVGPGRGPTDAYIFQRRIDVAEGELKTVNLGADLGPHKLTGKVFGKDGQPAPGATVVVKPAFAWDYMSFQAKTRADGSYEIQGLMPGAYNAAATLAVNPMNPNPPAEIAAGIELAADTQYDFHARAEFALTGRLAFAADFPAAMRANVRGVLLDPVNAPMPATQSITGTLQGNEARFSGYFKGQYAVAITIASSPDSDQTIVTLPGVLALDNTAADQNIGDIPVPSVGSVRLNLNFGGIAADALPGYMYLVLLANDANGAVTLMQSDPGAANQLLGPALAGTYLASVAVTGFKTPTPVAVTILPGAESPLSFSLTTEGFLSSSIVGPNAMGMNLPVAPTRISLTGNGIERTLTPSAPLSTPAEFQRRMLTGGDICLGGSFAFRELPDGEYTLSIEAPGYKPWTGKRSVKAGDLIRPSQIALTAN